MGTSSNKHIYNNPSKRDTRQNKKGRFGKAAVIEGKDKQPSSLHGVPLRVLIRFLTIWETSPRPRSFQARKHYLLFATQPYTDPLWHTCLSFPRLEADIRKTSYYCLRAISVTFSLANWSRVYNQDLYFSRQFTCTSDFRDLFDFEYTGCCLQHCLLSAAVVCAEHHLVQK